MHYTPWKDKLYVGVAREEWQAVSADKRVEKVC
jgi:hypothetical protein